MHVSFFLYVDKLVGMLLNKQSVDWFLEIKKKVKINTFFCTKLNKAKASIMFLFYSILCKQNWTCAQVQQLIQDAIDPERLCHIFPGWGAWM